MVAPTAGSAVCGFSTIAGTGRGPQTRRSALHQNRGNKARISMKTKDNDKKSLSPRVSDQTPTTGLWPQAGTRRPTPPLLGSSTCRPQNRGNKARMSMKTKDKYKNSLSRTVPDQTPTARPRVAAVRPEFRRIVIRYDHQGLTEGRFDPRGL